MSLPTRTRVGSYEVTAALGAGGMGEVYRARDTRLGRDVALKILPDAFAADPDRLARFEREAQVLASLNHPNIAAIYGLEDAPPTASGQAAIKALVLELVEGQTLSDRIAQGPIPVAEALPIARQIAEALEAAHEQGIVHRDLKPANVKVRPNGMVKVLDFGLAKLAQASGTQGSMPDPSQSPTITTPAMTRAGVILGTAAYMSPQQATGKVVDTRADIWAFGCVLYEMLTGQRAFEGEGVPDTLARVLEREPDWTRLPPAVPPALRTYLARCLQKDPRQRVQAIGDVRLALEGAFEASMPLPAAPVAVTGWRRAARIGAALTVGGSLVGSLTWVAMRQPPPRVSRLQVASSGDAEPSVGYNDRDLAITRDGSRLIYKGNRGSQIFVRPLDALVPVAVYAGVPQGLFTSPDGQWIGFTDGGVLKKVAVSGGPAVTLATRDTSGASGATWGPDDNIIFATEIAATGLHRVSASGGPISVLTRPDPAKGEADHLWPEMLPGGRHVLFTITALSGGLGAAQVAVLDLQTGTYRVVLRGGSHAHYVPSGHLVYGEAGTLRAVAFDLASMEVRGTAVTVAPDVVTTSQGGVAAVVAQDGTLAYLSVGGDGGMPRTLVWVDRQGVETPIGAQPRPYFLPALSPDGTRVAVFANDQEGDIWLWDLGRTTLTRLTVVPGRDVVQVWTPDSRRLVFTSERAGGRNLFWQAANGTGTAERLTESSNLQYPLDVSPDGRQLIFSEQTSETAIDMMVMELDGTRRVTPLVNSRFTERNGTISPDGRWLAYEANDSGPFEIYVRPYPDVNSGRSIVAAGTKPIWAQSGRELFYVAPSGAIMRVGVGGGSTWAATAPSRVVREGYYTNPEWWGRSYDVSPDGQRFLMIKEGGPDGTAPPPSLVVVQHWVEELKRLVPAR